MKSKYLVLAPSLTILVGFLPFLFLSIFYSVFYSKEIVDIPLVYNTSVMIGDSLLLPITNYLIFRHMIRVKVQIKQNKKLFVICVIISFLISMGINLFAHLAWKNDNITDFIAFEYGKFSLIGVWHLVFSIIQTAIFLVFIALCFLSIKAKKSHLYFELKRIWLLIFIFTTLSIVDMLFKYIFIFSEKSFYEILILDKFAFVTPLTTIGLFVFFKYYEKRNR